MLYKIASHGGTEVAFKDAQLLKTIDIQITKFPNGNIQSHIFKDDAGNIFHYMYNIDGQMVSCSERNVQNVLLFTTFQTYYTNKNKKSSVTTYTDDCPGIMNGRSFYLKDEKFYRTDGTLESYNQKRRDGLSTVNTCDSSGRLVLVKGSNADGTPSYTQKFTYYPNGTWHTIVFTNADGTGFTVEYDVHGVMVS